MIFHVLQEKIAEKTSQLKKLYEACICKAAYGFSGF